MKILEINKNDLEHNIKVIKEAMNCQIIAVVKGNGYGLGLVEFTKVLQENGMDFFGVSTVEEAMELRNAGIKAKILLLSSTALKEEVKLLLQNNIVVTIGSKQAAEVVNEVANELNMEFAPAHVKIDTGFGRYGFLYDDIDTVVQAIKENTKIKVEGCFTHFSNAYEKKAKWTTLQYNRFLSVIENLKLNGIEPGMLHVCNSSAALKYPYMRLNAVRIGSAFTGRILVPNQLGLKKIAVLKAQVVEIKTLPKGYSVGYSNMYKTKKETKVAVLQTGCMDGVNIGAKRDCFRFIDSVRYLYNDLKAFFKENSLKVSINGKVYKAIGLIGLYHVIVDCGSDVVQVGDVASIEISPLMVSSKVERRYVQNS